MNLRARKREQGLIVGGEARIGLLPPEVTARVKARSTRRALLGVVVIALLGSVAGYGSVSVLAVSSALNLEVEQGKTTVLLREQGEFIAISQVERQLAVAAAAQQVGVATEIDWRSYFAGVRAALPAGDVVAFDVESATPLLPFGQSESPLQGERVATVIFTAKTTDLPKVEQWLDALESLDGFVDATPGSVSAEEEGGYSVTITLHVSSDAYWNRFAAATDADATQDEESE